MTEVQMGCTKTYIYNCNMKPQIKKNEAYVFYNKIDSFHYQTYVHILFSEENSLICPLSEEVYFFLIPCFQEAIRRHIFRMQSDLSVILLVKIR